jgi:hypothetical protein
MPPSNQHTQVARDLLAAVASSLNRAGLFGSPASFTALNRACRYGATIAAKVAASL